MASSSSLACIFISKKKAGKKFGCFSPIYTFTYNVWSIWKSSEQCTEHWRDLDRYIKTSVYPFTRGLTHTLKPIFAMKRTETSKRLTVCHKLNLLQSSKAPA